MQKRIAGNAAAKERNRYKFQFTVSVFPAPYISAYTSTKCAIEGLTETLGAEVRDFGIDTVLIKPGDHRSASKNYRSHSKMAEVEDSPYLKNYRKVLQKIASDEAAGSDPAGVGKLIFKIILKSKPKLRYTVGWFHNKLTIPAKILLPGRLYEKILRFYYNS